jgi:uncharacterized protein
MADHPNVELFRRGYTAFQSGDLDTVRTLFADDIVWNAPGNNHLAGTFRGVDDVIATFVRNFEESNGTFNVELHDILANDTHGVALARASAQKDGKSLSDNYTHVVHFENGKIKESWIFGEHQDQVDAFWG